MDEVEVEGEVNAGVVVSHSSGKVGVSFNDAEDVFASLVAEVSECFGPVCDGGVSGGLILGHGVVEIGGLVGQSVRIVAAGFVGEGRVLE